MNKIVQNFLQFEKENTGFESYTLNNNEIGLFRTDQKELLDIVTVVTFPYKEGKLRILDHKKEILEEYNESEKISPQIPETIDVTVKHKLFFGNLRVSKENLEDYPEGYNSFLTTAIKNLCRKTRNKEIGKVLSEADKRTVNDLDGFKKAINSFSPEKTITLILSQSLQHELDTLKDSNGAYIIKSNKSESTTYDLFVNNLIVVSDEVLGKKGEKVAFVGDLERYITLFERDKNTLKLVEDLGAYQQILQVTTQFNVQRIHKEDGLLIKWAK